MRRQDLVGAIVTFDPEGDEAPEEQLLVEFKGEGADGIVYAIAPLDEPSKSEWVIKFYKPDPRFEMETLHHSFRLAEDLYPDHPLRMSTERRLEMLTTEMLVRIDSGRLVFRVGLYRQLIQKTLSILERTCAEMFERKQPIGPALDDSPVRQWLDDNFLEYLGGLLEDDLIQVQYQPLFEHLREEIESAIMRWEAEGAYTPLSRNPFVNLLGLYVEDFIDVGELHHIGRSTEFVDRLEPAHTEGLFDLLSGLYFHLEARLEDVADQTDQDELDDHIEPDELGGRRVLEMALIGCDLLEQADGGRRAGLALLWKAYFLILSGKALGEVEAAARSSLGLLRGPSNLGNRHDALMLMAKLSEEHDSAAAARYRLEAEEIEHRFGIVDD